MKRKMQIIWVCVMAALFILPYPISNLFENILDTGNYEKREMATFPKLELLNLERFSSEFDLYVNDNLPFRNELITLYGLINIRLLNSSPSKRVIIGKDDWLFFNEGIADYQGTNLFSQEQLEQIKHNLILQRDKLKQQEKDFIVFIAPNKEQVYEDKIPDRYGELTQYTRAKQLYDYIKDEINIVYPIKELLHARERHPQLDFYYHSDTHWNTLGGYIGGKALLKEMGISIPEIEDLVLYKKISSYFDLADMMNLREYVKKDVDYDISGIPNALTECLEYDFSTVYRYKTDRIFDKKIMVIRDSFSTALAPIVSDYFKEAVFFHKDYYTTDMISEEKPDIVVVECVERYITELGTCTIIE